MDNMHEPEDQVQPEPGFRSIEHKVSTLERRIAEQQDQLRDHEKALVERIADVDDDRRMTVSKLQRAWQTQREEINERLRRQMMNVFGVWVLFLIVVGLALFLAYHQADSERQLLADDLAELRQELARTSGNPADADSLRTELNRLSAAVNEISSSLGRQDKGPADSLDTRLEDERIARDQADAVIGAEVARLEARLDGLMRELETLREALENAVVTKAASAAGLPDSSPAEDISQDAPQEPAAATGEPLSAISTTPSIEGVSSPGEAPAGAAQQPIDEDPGKTPLTGASPDAGTSKTLVVADDTYALQLIGFYTWDALLNFADRSDLPVRLYYREESVEGRPWFALIHSLHEDYASAEAQQRQLSPKLVAMDPWIRPLGAGAELRVLDTASQRRP